MCVCVCVCGVAREGGMRACMMMGHAQAHASHVNPHCRSLPPLHVFMCCCSSLLCAVLCGCCVCSKQAVPMPQSKQAHDLLRKRVEWFICRCFADAHAQHGVYRLSYSQIKDTFGSQVRSSGVCVYVWSMCV